MDEVPNCYYRISLKALVLDETRTRFLIVKEENGRWEMPGGGLDWNKTPQEDLSREVKEEMGVNVTWMSARPCYFLTDMTYAPKKPKAIVVYEATFDSLDFIPSDECVETRFVTAQEAQELDLFENVRTFCDLFDPANHTRQL